MKPNLSLSSLVERSLPYLSVLLLAAMPSAAMDPRAFPDGESGNGTRRFVEAGVPTTGLNRLVGEPVWRFPALESFVPIFGDPVATLGFRTLGAFDEDLGAGVGNAPALTADHPGTTILASHLDTLGLSFVGLESASVPSTVLNIPIHDTSVLVDERGTLRTPIPCADEVSDPSIIARAAPCNEAITLEAWLQARGRAFFTCRPDGRSRVSLGMRGLRPNRLYSVWAIVEDFASGPEFLIRPVPLGGVPNLVVTDRFGRGSLYRNLAYCPHQEPSFLGIAVVLRSNGENFGGVPVPFLNQQDPVSAFDGFAGLIPGTVAHVHLSFNVGGVPADER